MGRHVEVRWHRMLPQEPAPPRRVDPTVKVNLEKGDLVRVRRKIKVWTNLKKDQTNRWRGNQKAIDKNAGVGVFIGGWEGSCYPHCPDLQVVFGETVCTIDWEKAHHLSIVSPRQRNNAE